MHVRLQMVYIVLRVKHVIKLYGINLSRKYTTKHTSVKTPYLMQLYIIPSYIIITSHTLEEEYLLLTM